MQQQQLFQNIFRREENAWDNKDFLKGITQRYPYFGLAQFFALKNLTPGTGFYNETAAKTALFFPDLFLLNAQLQPDELFSNSYTGPTKFTEPVTQPAAEIKEYVPAYESKQAEIEIPEIKESLPDYIAEKEAPKEEVQHQQSSPPETHQVTDIPALEKEEQKEEVQHQQINTPDVPQEINIPAQEKEEQKEEVQHQQINTSEVPRETTIYTEEREEPVEELKPEEPETPIIIPVNVAESTPEIKEPETTKGEFTFEPLHATDYFASQGIKLSEAIAEADKLGKQLKSFTAWLKTMKKVHPESLPTANAAADTIVRNIAEKSNVKADVVTEAMAEVYVQQGWKGRAKDIYKQLSLLYPEKSAYFAAKIESLK